jgi:dolichol-phosphate mannosyltransferase
MNIVVVMPTYNEVDNIKKIVPAIDKVLKKMKKHKSTLLVVDGNSTDGTQEAVSTLSKKYPFVKLLPEKKKSGLGGAYVYAFKHAMKNLKPDVLVEMDADFQHDPNDLPRVVAPIEEGYDYVIGSRFTKGGSIPKGWGFHRKFLSIGGNIFSKIVLGIFSVNDFTTGFKASRVKGFVDKLDLDGILSAGFAYKIDLLFKMHRLGAKIKEVPIAFGLRDGGDSKMERNNALDSLKVVISLRVNENKSFFKFVVVGFIGLFTDITLSNIFRILLPVASVAASIAAFLAMMVTFALNNFWSFSDKKVTGSKNLAALFVPYALVSVVPIIFRFWFVGFIVSRFGNTLISYNGAIFVSVVFGLIWNFTFYSKIIWGKKK